MEWVFFGFTIGFIIGAAVGMMAGSAIEMRHARQLREWRKSRGL
jgi:hypothetical protein